MALLLCTPVAGDMEWIEGARRQTLESVWSGAAGQAEALALALRGAQWPVWAAWRGRPGFVHDL